MHAITLRIFSKLDGEVKVEETTFVNDLAALDKLTQDFVLTVFGQEEHITIELKFDPPLPLDDQPAPPEIES